MHYICTGGCKGVSQGYKNCEDQSCSLYGQPLEPCDCDDGKHFGKHEDKPEHHQESTTSGLTQN